MRQSVSARNSETKYGDHICFCTHCKDVHMRTSSTGNIVPLLVPDAVESRVCLFQSKLRAPSLKQTAVHIGGVLRLFDVGAVRDLCFSCLLFRICLEENRGTVRNAIFSQWLRDGKANVQDCSPEHVGWLAGICTTHSQRYSVTPPSSHRPSLSSALTIS